MNKWNLIRPDGNIEFWSPRTKNSCNAFGFRAKRNSGGTYGGGGGGGGPPKRMAVENFDLCLGVHVINLRRTWEKLVLAARAIAAIENPADVCVISARPYGQRAILKFAAHTGATAIAGRFTPGMLCLFSDDWVQARRVRPLSVVSWKDSRQWAKQTGTLIK